MSQLWDFYWPVAVAAVVIGLIAGRIAYRLPKTGDSQTYRRRRLVTLTIAGTAILLVGWVWHAPAGRGEKFATTVEQQTRQVLVDFEMEPVHARLVRNPLKRSLVLTGPADDFQRSELVRILNDVPGVAEVHWGEMQGSFVLPLLAEVELAALISFGFGLLLAYLLELRRRYNAQWSW